MVGKQPKPEKAPLFCPSSFALRPLSASSGTIREKMRFMTQPPDTPDTFASLGVPDLLLRTLDDLGYEAPTPIQARTIPALMEGRDLIGQAQTGTAKTAAF